MRSNAISVRITAILTGFSFVWILITHYAFQGTEAEFWCNICLAIFGSGLLTLITTCVGYATEKRNTLENFYYDTQSLIHIIKKYDSNWTLEKKIDFFLDYANKNKSVWDARMGAIYFLYDPYGEKYKYIYEKIYKPIKDLNRKIAECAFHFNLHKEGTGRNDAVMEKLINGIEELLLRKTITIHTSDTGQITRCVFVKYIFVNTIYEELSGRYYDIMYGKKQTKKGGNQNEKDANGNA